MIESIVQKEARRNSDMIRQYEQLIEQLPKGSLICRRGYYYLRYRKAGRLCDEYIGKDMDVVSSLENRLAQRKHSEVMLAALRKEQKAIDKILGGFR